MEVASDDEIDRYFAEKYPCKSKKILCHKCGGAVDNSAQQLKAAIALVRKVAFLQNHHPRGSLDMYLSDLEQRAAV